MNLKDVFHAAWGPNLHIGIFDPPTLTVPQAAERANARMMAALAPRPGERALELGCGFGLVSTGLARDHGCRATGSDLADWRLARAVELAHGVAGVDFVLADHSALPFAGDSFDLLWIAETLIYAPDCGRSLAEAARVLRPGGRAAILESFVSGLLNPGPLRALNHSQTLWSLARWRAALRANGLGIAREEDWSAHSLETYRRLAEDFRAMAPGPAVAEAVANMAARVTWVERGGFGHFFMLLVKD